MGDPLSVAASIAGCLSLGIQALQSLHDYYTAFRDRDTRIEGICRRADDLLTIFQRLKKTLEEREFSADEKPLIEKIERSVKSCEETVVELQEQAQKIGKYPGQGWRHNFVAAGRRVAYPFRETSLKTLDDDIRYIRENITLAVEVLQLTDSSRIRFDTEELKSLINLFRSTQLSKDVVEWLKAPDATIDHNEACVKANPGSGLWLLNHPDFTAWLKTGTSFVWLYGFAGCGKSVLCSTIIQRTLMRKTSSLNVGIAFFYFTFNNESKRNLSSLLRAFLLQLSNQFADGNSHLKELKDKCHGDSPSQPLLAAALREMIGKFHDTYLVIDALDEVPLLRDRNSVVSRLKTLLEDEITNVHILVTSRDHPDIRDQIQHLGSNISMKNEGVDKDVADFVSAQLQENMSLSKLSAYHDQIKESLVSRANGIFRWVECQLESLARCPRGKAALEKRLASLPESLDETYERMLLGIDADFVDYAKRIFTLLCFASRPMTVAEVIDGLTVRLEDEPYVDLNFRMEDEDDILKICPGLVDISFESTDSEPKLRIAHFSVQEYLESDRIRDRRASNFSLNRSKGHEEISVICLAYLLDPFFSNAHLRDEMLDERPLTTFAATSWYRHYGQIEAVSSITESLIKKLLLQRTPNFIHWAQIHDKNCIRLLEGFMLNRRSSVASPIYYASLVGIASIIPFLQLEEETQPSKDGIRIREKYGCPLQAASSNGHEDVVRRLIEKGAAVNIIGGTDGSAIQAAASGGYLSILRLLVENGADVNLRGGISRCSALQLASQGGYGELAQFLINNGAVVDAIDRSGRTPLQAASAAGNMMLVQLLINQGADLNVQGEKHGSALLIAASRGFMSIVELLIHNGADLNIESERYGTALQAAAQRGFRRVVEILLDNGAKVNTGIGFHGSALPAASAEGHLEVAQLLLDKCADVNNPGGNYGSAIQAAAQNGHTELVKLLISHGADVNICSDGGRFGPMPTALEAASFGGHQKILQLLLDNGADVNALTSKRRSALEAASFRGDKEVVELLLSRCANVNVRRKKRASALQMASSRGYKEVMEILLDAGADIDWICGAYKRASTYCSLLESYESLLVTKLELEADRIASRKRRFPWGGIRFQSSPKRKIFSSASEAIPMRDLSIGSIQDIIKWCSPLQMASLWGDTDVVRFLLRRGAKVNAISKLCGTALQAAIFWDNKEIVDILLNHGVDINDASGELGTALQVASLRGHKATVELLLARRAGVNIQGGTYGCALQAASKAGHLEVAQILLDHGAYVNAKGGYFGSALVAAILSESEELALLLLGKGADVNTLTKRFGSSLMAALRSRTTMSDSFVKHLIDGGADVNAQFDRMPYGAIQAAALSGKLWAAQFLLDKGAIIDAGVGVSMTALQMACRAGSSEMIQLLLDHGADVNASFKEGDTVLNEAITSYGDSLEIVKILIGKGANINTASRKGGSALQTAAHSGNIDTVRLLVEKGAEINARGGRYGNALQAAAYASSASYEIVDFLLERGADVHAIGDEFGNALQAAAHNGDYDVVKLLLDRGADVNARGGKYGCALQAAISEGNRDIAQLLVDRGADRIVEKEETGTMSIESGATSDSSVRS